MINKSNVVPIYSDLDEEGGLERVEPLSAGNHFALGTPSGPFTSDLQERLLQRWCLFVGNYDPAYEILNLISIPMNLQVSQELA